MKHLMTLLLLLGLNAGAETVRFYLGTYTKNSTNQGPNSPSKGIYTATLDTASGVVSPLVLAARSKDPSYLAISPDRGYLYAISADFGGGTNGTVLSFRKNADGTLQHINGRPTGSVSAHLSLDTSGQCLFVASYGASNIMAFPILPNGAIGRKTSFIVLDGPTGPDKSRQDQAHPHSVYVDPSNRHLYVCDLGTDKVDVYDLDVNAARLKPDELPSGDTFARVPPGSGPRHLAFSRDGKYAYVNGEMGLNVTVFEHDATNGSLTAIQTVSTVPPDADRTGVTTAEIFCHPSGKWLYVSNRGRGSIAVFAIGRDGKLTWLQDAPAGVKVPRGFGIDPTGHWLIAGDQSGDKISLLKIDNDTGKLSFDGKTISVGSPVCVGFE